MAVKIVFFNHKGGVSKTTTTYNLGWKLATKGHKVLLVDADPQCNLTSMILGDDFDNFYEDSATKHQNIKDGVKVAFEGKPKPIEAVCCYSHPKNTNLLLLAGHANLSEYDASLSFAQTSNNAITTLMNLPGSFNELLNKTAERYAVDFVLIDLNPGLSAINQNFFIISDAFIIPTNPDPFSVMALNALAKILPRWAVGADNMRNLFSESSYPLPENKPKFIGEIIQRYNIRNGQPARTFTGSINDIKNAVSDNLVPALRRSQMLFDTEAYREADIGEVDFSLAEIPDFQSILQKANAAGVPVFALTDDELSETGVVLRQLQDKREEFNGIFEGIANKIVTISKYASSQQPVFG